MILLFLLGFVLGFLACYFMLKRNGLHERRILLKAKFQNIKDAMGKAFLPVVSEVIDNLSEMAGG